MIIADLAALRTPLDDATISGATQAVVNDVVEDLISATIAQDAYQTALPLLKMLDTVEPARVDYVSRTALVFGQAWVRCVRDVADGLTILAEDPVALAAAREAARAFGLAFPGVAGQTGAMRAMIGDEDQIYFAVGPARYPVRINDAAVHSLEAVVQTLIDGLPKAKPFRAVG